MSKIVYLSDQRVTNDRFLSPQEAIRNGILSDPELTNTYQAEADSAGITLEQQIDKEIERQLQPIQPTISNPGVQAAGINISIEDLKMLLLLIAAGFILYQIIKD